MDGHIANSFRVIVFSAVVMCALLCILMLCLRLQTVEGFQIDNKLNPNFATAGELSQLPGIGTQRAQAIVEYRRNIAKEPNAVVFRSVHDLTYVEGIGAKTAEKISVNFSFGNE